MRKEQLQEDLKKAMFARDELKKSVLRMLLSAITYYEIEKGRAGYKASEEDVMNVIQRQVKQRKDSIEQFQNAGRTELADRETQELHLLQTYMPEQMTEDEIKKIVKDAISQADIKSMHDIGKVMSIVMPQIKGKADGNVVNKIVRDNL